MSNTELLNKLLELTIWLPIKDYPNYEVSICGSVRNVKTKRILRPSIRAGYYAVVLCKNNTTKTLNIHRLVCKAFIPNLNNEKCVDHKNNDKLDNTVSNLRWASHQENNFNRQLSSKNTSSIKGVYWNKKMKKWHTRIMINNKNIHLGYFDNLDDAKNARQINASELFKEFLNDCEK